MITHMKYKRNPLILVIAFAMICANPLLAAKQYKAADQSLIQAVYNNNLWAIKKAVRDHADINVTVTDNKYYLEDAPVLQLAITLKREGILDFLLEQKADMEAIDKYGITAIGRAAYLNNLPYVKKLIAEGAGVNVVRDIAFGPVEPLYWAVKHGNIDMLNTLSIHGTSFERGQGSLIKTAVEAGNVEVLQYLLAKGVNPDALAYPSQENGLYRAIVLRSPEMAKILMSHGASPSTKSYVNIVASPEKMSAKDKLKDELKKSQRVNAVLNPVIAELSNETVDLDTTSTEGEAT
jgi:ankyrin repeat protein